MLRATSAATAVISNFSVRTGGFVPPWSVGANPGGAAQVVISAPYINGVDSLGRPIFGLPFLLTGLELQYVGTTTLRLLQGSWNAGLPHRVFGFDLFGSSSFMDFTYDNVGLNGLDKDYRGAGVAPFINTGWYYGYLLGKSASPWNDTRVILSKEISITGVRGNLNANVPAAAAYDYIRKMPFAAYYNSALVPADFRYWNMKGGYPLPFYEYQGADCSSAYAIIENQTYVAETFVDCSVLVPDNGRYVDRVVKLVSSAGGGGTATVRTPGVAGTGDCIAIEPTATVPMYRPMHMITNSGRQILVQTPADTQISIYGRGFGIRELV